jgi:hypothetical protein
VLKVSDVNKLIVPVSENNENKYCVHNEEIFDVIPLIINTIDCSLTGLINNINTYHYSLIYHISLNRIICYLYCPIRRAFYILSGKCIKCPGIV